ILRHGQVLGGGDKTSEEEIKQSKGKDQPDKAPSQKDLMGDDLEGLDLGNQLYMSDDKEEESEVKEHQDGPKERLVPSGCGQQEGIPHGPEPPRSSFRVDLQRRGVP